MCRPLPCFCAAPRDTIARVPGLGKRTRVEPNDVSLAGMAKGCDPTEPCTPREARSSVSMSSEESSLVSRLVIPSSSNPDLLCWLPTPPVADPFKHMHERSLTRLHPDEGRSVGWSVGSQQCQNENQKCNLCHRALFPRLLPLPQHGVPCISITADDNLSGRL